MESTVDLPGTDALTIDHSRHGRTRKSTARTLSRMNFTSTDFWNAAVVTGTEERFEEQRVEREESYTAEEARNVATAKLLFATFTKAERERKPALLAPLAKLFAEDAVALNVRLLGSPLFPYSLPTTGGREYLKQREEMMFGEYDVLKVGEYVDRIFAAGPVILVKSSISAMNVRATGRAIRNVSKKPMQEVYSLTFTDEGKLQQFLWYIEADKKELYENAFTKD